MHKELGVAQLVKWNAKKARVYVRAFSVHLEREKRSRVGRVHGLLAVAAPPKAGDALAANIEDALERGIEEALRRLPAKASQTELFEAAVSRLNNSLSLLLDEHGLPIDPDEVHAAVVSQLEGNIAVASWGKPTLLLLRKQKQGVGIFDLGGSGNDRPSFDNTVRRRGFSDLIIGKISGRDRLLIATRDVRLALDEQVLDAVIAAGDAETMTSAVQAAPGVSSDENSLALLVLGMEADAPRPAPRVPVPAPRPEQSIAQVGKEQLQAVVALKESLAPRFLSATASFRQIAGSAAKSAASGLALLATSAGREKISISAKETLQRGPTALVERFSGLSLLKKIAVIGLAGIVVAFSFGLVVLGWQHQKEEAIAAYEEKLGEVGKKIDAAETSMLYKDDSRAKSLLAEATTMMDALTVAPEGASQAVTALHSRIADTRRSLHKGLSLPAATKVAALPDDAQVARLTRADGGTWVLASDGSTYRIAGDGAVEKLGSIASTGAKPSFLFFSGSGSLLAGSEDGAVTGFRAGKAKAVSLQWTSGEVSPTAVAPWGASLYILDSQHNRILKQTAATDTSYGKPAFYLKDATDVSSAADLAIDGAIYILLKTGKVLRVTKGLGEAYALGQPDPAVTAATRIWTNEQSKALYILEPAMHRVLKFDKASGNFLAQLESPDLADATEFSVDEKSRELYASSKNEIVKFALPE